MYNNRLICSRTQFGVGGWFVALTLVLLPVVAVAEEDEPTLAVAEAADFLGDWVLSVEAPQGAFELDFKVEDRDGLTVASFDMPQIGPTTVQHILKTEGGIQLVYSLTFGEQMFNMTMDLARTEEGLAGKMADTGGLFSMSFTGVDREAFEAQAAAGGDEGQSRRRRGGETGTAELEIAGGKLRVRYDRVSIDDDSYGQVAEPRNGDVVRFPKNRPCKLWTPTDLRFGEIVIAAGNHGPDYPGVYSLWLKQVAGEWRLVVNNLADAWGTQHDPAADVAEIPLQSGKAADPSPDLSVALEANDGGGILRISWGAAEWSALFTVAGANAGG